MKIKIKCSTNVKHINKIIFYILDTFDELYKKICTFLDKYRNILPGQRKTWKIVFDTSKAFKLNINWTISNSCIELTLRRLEAYAISKF